MTSSFGTLVGKERDTIPDLSATNYEATEPDLTGSVNAQIDANIQDTKAFYDEMAQIQKTIAETPLVNLEAAAQFSNAARGAIQTFKNRQEAQEKITEAMNFLDKNSSAVLRDAEGKLNLEEAKFDNQLLNENTEASINFLRTRNAALPQDASLNEILRQLNDNYFGARNQFINENGGQEITDSQEFINLHNAADELMITAMLDRAKRAGIDTDSRAFRKAFYNTIYPDIQQRRENNIQSWKARADRNFTKARDKKLRNVIVDTLSPYYQGARFDIDVETLVQTIMATRPEFDKREAVNYLFAEVAEEVTSEQGRLKLHHLNYLYEDALYVPSYAPNTRVTYEQGKFKDKDANYSLIQDVDTELSDKEYRREIAAKRKAQRELDDFYAEYPGEVPNVLLEQKYLELEQKYPNVNVRQLQTSSRGITNGGEYPQAGQGNLLQPFYDQLKDRYTAKIGKDSMTGFNKREIERAQGALAFEVGKLTGQGVDFDSAVRNVYDDIEKGLLNGQYTGTEIEKRRGKRANPADIAADSKVLQADIGKVQYQGEYVSLYEKQALADLKRHYIDPTQYAFPEYFKGVVNGTKLNYKLYAMNRLKATDGLNDQGLIKTLPYIDKNGVLVDPQYDLNLEQLNTLEVKPHLTKTYSIMQDPEKAKKILKGFQTGQQPGDFDSASGPMKKNADTYTIGELLGFGKRGAGNFGMYGFTYQELKDAVQFLPPSFQNQLFTEENQSFLVFELIRQRANRTNSIRGAIIQAKKGGDATIFQGDEGEGAWWRLTKLDKDEQNALLNVFPELRNYPMNDFRNLTGGVVLGIQTEIANYNKNREKLRKSRAKQGKNKEKVFGYGRGQIEPTTIEELKQVPAVKKSREGR